MNIFDVFTNPSMMHAAAVHMPIVLAMTGFLLVLASAIFDGSRTLRYITIINYVMLLGSVQYGITTGEEARAVVPNTLPQGIWDLVDAHEQMALRLRIFAFATLVFALFTLVPHVEFRKGMLLLTGAMAFVVALIVGATAHYGGILVYEHGVGTELVRMHPELLESETPEEDLVPIQEIDPVAASQIDFATQVWPIIDRRCLSCHEGPDADGGYDMSSIEAMSLPGEKAGPGIVPGEPDESAMILYIRGVLTPRMPHKEPPMNPDELHVLRAWIAAGARAMPAPPEPEGPAFDPFGG